MHQGQGEGCVRSPASFSRYAFETHNRLTLEEYAGAVLYGAVPRGVQFSY